MITGAKYWEDGDFYHQDNNSTEGLLKALKRVGLKGYLETCGPSAACNCLAALGYCLSYVSKGSGLYFPQPEDILTNCLNDPRLQGKRDEIRRLKDFPNNRVPQFYPWAVKKVFGAIAEYREQTTWENTVREMVQGNPVQICFKKPGHYVAIVAYDEDLEELIYKDSWKGNPMNHNDGKNERLKKEYFYKNVEWYSIVYRAK